MQAKNASKPVKLNELKFSSLPYIINILLTEVSQSVWENLDFGRVFRPHGVRSVLTTSVNILPYRPPAVRLIRANINADRRTREKRKHAPRATIILLVSLIMAFQHPSSYLAVHCLLVWGLSAYKPTRSSSFELILRLLILDSYFSDIIHLRAFRVNTIDSF